MPHNIPISTDITDYLKLASNFFKRPAKLGTFNSSALYQLVFFDCFYYR